MYPRLRMWIRDVDFPEALIEAHRAGQLVIFVGAGASRDAPSDLPDFRTLTAHIAAEAQIDPRDGELQQPDVLLGRLADQQVDVHRRVAASVDALTRATKVVFSSSLEEPLTWATTTLVRGDAVEAVRAMKQNGSGLMSTIGSLSLCRSLLRAGLVDRFRVVMFPVITGAAGAERIYDGYPDVALEMIDHRTFDGRIQLVEYRPEVVGHPPLGSKA